MTQCWRGSGSRWKEWSEEGASVDIETVVEGLTQRVGQRFTSWSQFFLDIMLILPLLFLPLLSLLLLLLLILLTPLSQYFRMDAGSVQSSLAASCLLNALYVCTTYLLACPTPDLHLAKLPRGHLPKDLRLFDYSWRYRLNATCLVALIRAVHAARHVAYHYDTWHTQTGSTDVSQFTDHVFDGRANPDEIRDMIRDGHRLGWLEKECQNSYVGFVVALDWPRFQATPDFALLRAMQDVLAVPAARSLVMLLEPQWPWQSFSQYHGKSYCRD